MSRHARHRPFRPVVEALESRAVPSVCTVDRLTDLDEGKDGRGDLRYCVIESLFRADTINFEVDGVINLTRALPDLVRSVSIEGPGADLLTVRRSGGGFYRIFTVSADVTVSISGLKISQSNLGGIQNMGTLTLSNSVVSQNYTDNSGGGGILNGGTLTVHDSTIVGNVTIANGGEGGGILNVGIMALTSSTVSGNSAPGRLGGGIYNAGTLTVSNSTLSGNDAGYGGGIVNRGTLAVLTITGSTISGNVADPGTGRGGGIWADSGSMSVRNTIIAGNTAAAGSDVYGNLGSQGYNLIGNPQDGSGFHKTDLLHVNPRLGPLQDNGGPTWTRALLPGSPALDAGDSEGATEFDQRGLSRVVADAIDIGGFEVQPGPATWFWLEAPAAVAAGVPFDVTLYALDDYGHLAIGYEGTVAFATTDKDPSVVLPGDYTFTADEQGLHTFAGESLLFTPGEHYLSAVDTESGAYGETPVTVMPSGAPGPRGGGPRAVLNGSLLADLAFTPIRLRARLEWFLAGLLVHLDG